MCEELLHRLRSGYLNCFLPSNEYLEESLKKYIGVKSVITERTDEKVVIKLGENNDTANVVFNLRNGSNDRKCVNKIEVCE